MEQAKRCPECKKLSLFEHQEIAYGVPLIVSICDLCGFEEAIEIEDDFEGENGDG